MLIDKNNKNCIKIMKMFYATSLLSNRLQIKYKETVVFFEIIFGIR